MLPYNEIKEKKFILLDETPFEVLSSHVFRKQQRKPVNQTKLRNLLTGKVTERSFHQSEKVEEADLVIKNIKYLYNKRDEYWFCDEHDPSKRFALTAEHIGDKEKFLKQNETVEGMYINDEMVNLRLPIKIDLKVTEAPPSTRGNTAQGGTKQVTLETGLSLSVPLFVNEGDTVRVNTESGEYTERV